MCTRQVCNGLGAGTRRQNGFDGVLRMGSHSQGIVGRGGGEVEEALFL